MPFAFIAGRGDAGALDGPYTTGTFNSTLAKLIVLSLSYAPTSTPVVSDLMSNPWTPLPERDLGTGAATRLYYKANPVTSAVHTVTVDGAGITSGIAIACFSGQPGATDQATSAIANTTSLATGSVTPTENNELIVTGFVKDHNETPSINGGFAIAGIGNYVPGSNYMAALAYLIQTTAAAANPSWSWATNANAGATIQTFTLAGLQVNVSELIRRDNSFTF